MQIPLTLSEKIKGFSSFGLVYRFIRAPEAVALLTIKYAFSHFSWYFSSKKLTYIHVGTSQNISM